jgi:proteasome accessory factor B
VDKLERLMNLVAVLLDTSRPLSAEDLRRQVPGYPEAGPTFHRAFERDKDDLREMGVPVVVETIPGTDPPRDGYRIPREEYYLADPGLEPDELAALHLAVSTVQLGGRADAEALWKLGGVIAADGVGTTPGGGEPVASLPADARLPALFEAVSERRRVRFVHGGVERQVDPHRLDFRRGRWYLTGHDHERGAERSYRLDRIEGDIEVEGPAHAFERPVEVQSGAERQPWELGDEAPVEARVRIDPDQAGWAVQLAGEEAVADRGDDGSVELRLPVSNPVAFRSFVLTFLEHAEVLEPPELRDDLVRWLEQVG